MNRVAEKGVRKALLERAGCLPNNGLELTASSVRCPSLPLPAAAQA